MLLQMTAASQPRFGGPEWEQNSEKKAQRLLSAELSRHNWTEAEFARLAKGHGAKIEIAKRLRAETIMAWAWIAERLIMGSPAYAANLCRCQS